MTDENEASRLSDHLQHDHPEVEYFAELDKLCQPVLETDTAYKAVSFIETYTGRAFYPLNPSEDVISVIDIAHALSNQCRYSGHVEKFYSTAQHCCILADYVANVSKGSPLDCLQILMHDSAEAYLVDIPRPVKQFMPMYRKWDRDITMCVRSWLGLYGVPIPDWQDILDSAIVNDEREHLMCDSGLEWNHAVRALGVEINDAWLPPVAEQQFLMRYAQYSAAVFGKVQYLRSGWGIPTDVRYTEDGAQAPFRTLGSDVAQRGPRDPRVITDLIEVDIRGGVGRVALRSEDGMMIRDTAAGSFPRPAWEFIHGKFELTFGDQNGVG